MGSVNYNFSLKKMRRTETKSVGITVAYLEQAVIS